MSKRKTTEEFITDAIKIHVEKYDYSNIEYPKNNKTKILSNISDIKPGALASYMVKKYISFII